MLKQILEYYKNDKGEGVLNGRNFLGAQDEKMVYEVSQSLSKYGRSNNLFSMMDENLGDLHFYITNLKANKSDRKSISQNTNRYMMNYLAMAKLFLDKTEEDIKETFSKDSSEFREFKLLTSKNYDEKFSYRFLYDLRNYTQHYGFPIHNIRSFLDEEQKSQTQVSISCEQLLGGTYKWKPVILKDLTTRKENINVLEIIEEHFISLKVIYQYNLSCYAEELIKSIVRYQEFKKENDYLYPLYYVKFKSYKEYRKAKQENYSGVSLLLDEFLIRDCLNDLEELHLIKYVGDKIEVYGVKKHSEM